MKRRKIHHHPYDEGGFDFVDIYELPTEFRSEFATWMEGQTFPLIPGVPGAVYAWDFDRWFEMKFKGIPTCFD